MTLDQSRHLVRRYLLGDLTGSDQENCEEKFMTGETSLTEIEAAEDELLDEYLAGRQLRASALSLSNISQHPGAPAKAPICESILRTSLPINPQRLLQRMHIPPSLLICNTGRLELQSLCCFQ